MIYLCNGPLPYSKTKNWDSLKCSEVSDKKKKNLQNTRDKTTKTKAAWEQPSAELGGMLSSREHDGRIQVWVTSNEAEPVVWW